MAKVPSAARLALEKSAPVLTSSRTPLHVTMVEQTLAAPQFSAPNHVIMAMVIITARIIIVAM